MRGVEVREETDYSDYEKVNGTYIAFASASGGVGDTQKNSRFTSTRREANVAIDDVIVRLPRRHGAGK